MVGEMYFMFRMFRMYFESLTDIVNQLDIRLQKIKKEGLENFQKRYNTNTQYLREKLTKLGLNTFVKSKAN